MTSPKLHVFHIYATVAATLVALVGCNLRTSVFSGGRDGGNGAQPPNQSPSPSGPGYPGAPVTPTTPGPSSPSGTHFSEDDLKASDDVVGYARFCKQELEIPPDVLKPWNCLDGAEIPTTIGGQPLNAQNYPQLSSTKAGCDLPSWLGDAPCANYGFVQQRNLTPDVKAVLLCRMRTFSTYKGKAERLRDLQASVTPDTFNNYYAFDSLGLIWTNARTGKTCYFDFVGKVYGGYVASPDDERVPTIADMPDPKPPAAIGEGTPNENIWRKNGRMTWRAPRQVAEQDNCISCHDTGALKDSPWIAQVFNVPVNDPNVPYQIVGKVFDTWHQRFPVKAISTAPIARPDGTQEPQVCTSCHRIGSLSTCSEHLLFAVGQQAPAKTSALGVTFFYRTWMPPPPAEWHGKSETELNNLWNAAYAQHVNRMKCCCANPNSINCTSQDITVSPLPPPVAGTGPATCP